MKHRNRGRLAGFSLVVALVACADGAERVAGPAPASTQALETGAEAAFAERAALSRIGRLVAKSLKDRQLRHRLKKDLRAAPFKEHKLELRRYLRSADGSQLLRSMAAAGGSSPDAILTTLEQVRSLELYMPVRKHRDNWVGDGELLVATQLEGKDAIVAFNGSGQEVQVDASTPPAQPTLSIVSTETRFDEPMPVGSRNVDDRGGQAIGTLMPPQLKPTNILMCNGSCGGGEGGGTGAPPAIPAGMYLEFSRILDMKEPWTRGSPEIEVHIQGPTDQGNPRVGEDLSCSGEHAFDYRKAFDQNTPFWEGRVMLFSADEINRFNSRFSDGFHVLVWEDDDTSCVLKLNNDVLLQLLKATAAMSSAALRVVPFQWRIIGAIFLAAYFTNPGEMLKTNDDFVGAVVSQQEAGFNYPNNTHVIMEGTTLNGRATIVYR